MFKTLIPAVSIFLTSFSGYVPTSEEHIYAFSSEENITIDTNEEIKENQTYYAYVYVDNLTNVASISLSIAFDSSLIEIQNYYNSYSNSVYDDNLSDGLLNVSYIFNNRKDEEIGRTNLFYFTFKVKENAELGFTYFDVLINDAYDYDLNQLSLTGERNRLEIIQKEEVVNKAYINLNTSNVNTKVLNEFEITYSILPANKFGSGKFEITYDEELFEVVEIEKLDFFANNTVDINQNNGIISFAFIKLNSNYNSNLFKIRFKTIKNTEAKTSIDFTVKELYGLDLSKYQSSGNKTNVNVAYDESYTGDAPAVYFSLKEENIDDKTFKLSTKLEKESHLGAGDFEINWNTNYLKYISYEQLGTFDMFFVDDKNVEKGILKFHILNLEDVIDEKEFLDISFEKLYQHDDVTDVISINGTSLGNSLTNPIKLNFVDYTYSITGEHSFSDERTIDKEATCTEKGEKSHHCIYCDERKDVTSIPTIEHSYGEWVVTQEPGCESEGTREKVCSECGHKVTESIPATGHTYGEWITTKEATCTEDGLREKTCSECGHKVTEVIKAAGHDYEDTWTIRLDHNKRTYSRRRRN